jgi:Protein of unknown function (DUF3168)
MAEAVFALRKAIVAKLAADAALIALMGAGRVYDEVPRGAEPPYLVLGDGSVRDWSTSSDRGHEHAFIVAAWSRQGGAAQAFDIAAAAAAALAALPAALDGHRLVNLVVLATEVRRDRERRLTQATMRLRAVTESLA